MRALLQGLNEKESWNRYLREDGEPADSRTIRQTVAWIRDAFAAAARREDRPGTARLVRLDPEKFRTADPLPTLEAFAAMHGMEDFSEAEQAEAYASAYPAASQGTGSRGQSRPAHRSRVVERQLEALRWLENHVAPEPRPSDHVSAWLNPAIAERLDLAGIATLGNIVSRIDRDGARWWRSVPGVGSIKAARVMAWLKLQDPSSALVPAPHSFYPPASVPAAVRERVVPAGTTLVPLEKLIIPEALDGSDGRFRAAACGLELPWRSDRDALLAWLDAKCPDGRREGATPTARRYRKEAERLLLWSVLERRLAVSSLTKVDAAAYLDFLSAPPAHWCGPRHHERWSAQWRPLEGPMAPTSVEQVRVMLRGLFGWLVQHGHLRENAFDGIPARAGSARRGAKAPNSQGDVWGEFEGFLTREASSPMNRRVLRCLRWTRLSGLPLERLAQLRCKDLRAPTSSDAAWMLQVRSEPWLRRGGAPDYRAIPAELVRELCEELARYGRPRDAGAIENAQVWLLGPYDGSARPRRWTAAAMAKAIQATWQSARTLSPALHGSKTGSSTTPGVRQLRKISPTRLSMSVAERGERSERGGERRDPSR
jgi:hypothetical protein